MVAMASQWASSSVPMSVKSPLVRGGMEYLWVR